MENFQKFASFPGNSLLLDQLVVVSQPHQLDHLLLSLVGGLEGVPPCILVLFSNLTIVTAKFSSNETSFDTKVLFVEGA